MKRTIYWILFLALSMAFSSCGIYYPQSVDMPLLEAKNDCRIDAGVNVTGVHASIAYGLTDHIALQTHCNSIFAEDHYMQIAPGWYHKFDKSVMEIYCGYGAGRGTRHYAPHVLGGGSLTGNYFLYFAQLDYGRNHLWDKNIDLAFGVKGMYVDGSAKSEWDEGCIRHTDMYRGANFLIEPAAEMRFGWDHLKFSVSVGYIVPITNSILFDAKYNSNFFGTIGLNYYFHL